MIPRDYQLPAIEAALPHEGFALFMEQRTGKTPTALWIRERWACKDTIIVCPKKAIPVWEKAIKDMGQDPAQFFIINFEQLRLQFRELKEVKWDLAIVDESHRIKERGSIQTKACWAIGRVSRKRLILTGSPQGQGGEDYYSQLRFIRPDLFPTWGDFSEKYLVIEEVTLFGREDPFPKIVGYKNQEEFKDILQKISFRVTRDEVSKIPTKVRHITKLVQLSDETRHHYNALERDLITFVNGQEVSAPMALVKALKLHQLCGGYIKDDDGKIQKIGDEKFQTLFELLEGELKGEGVVIVAQYKAEMDHIARFLDRKGVTYVQIRGKHPYNPEDRSQVTIMHPSAGEAINLAHNRHMIIYSMNHSYLKWVQFKDRIVLVDTPWVKYYYLIAENSMDEVVYNSVVKKKKLSDEILSIYKRNSLRYNVSSDSKTENPLTTEGEAK